ncbi:hypothetical protein H5410_018344 [Solanum commersonii]|uniref:Uncharacterized protein n=1 Tax=Solanum commersonii TaxID=4109 RepID=A0A9J6A250_SOLCO|nr:hypothetical protein H5410_018344 [Solanum commersonii]
MASKGRKRHCTMASVRMVERRPERERSTKRVLRKCCWIPHQARHSYLIHSQPPRLVTINVAKRPSTSLQEKSGSQGLKWPGRPWRY